MAGAAQKDPPLGARVQQNVLCNMCCAYAIRMLGQISSACRVQRRSVLWKMRSGEYGTTG